MDKLTAEQQQMVLDNYNLVHYVLHKKFPSYTPLHQEYEDLAQEGYVGLCMAVMNYNDEISKFSTYAFNYIWGYVMRYLNTKSGWKFSIRKSGHEGGYVYIPYDSLNIVTCEGGASDTLRELLEIVPDRKDIFTESELFMDLLPAFKKANRNIGEKIFYLILEGRTQQEIADILGTNRQASVSRTITKAKTIYYSCSEYDPKYPDPTIFELKQKGYSDRSIGQILQITVTEVRKAIRRMETA